MSEGQVLILGGIGGKAPDSLLHQVVVTLTDAQIKTLPTSGPIVLVAAPGLNRVIVPTFALLQRRFNAPYLSRDAAADFPTLWLRLGSVSVLDEFFDDGDNADIRLFTSLIGSDEGGLGMSFMQAHPKRSSSVFGTFAGSIPMVGTFIAYGDGDSISGEGLQLGITNSVNLTGGDSNNLLRLTITYMVLDTATGLYE